MNKINQIITDDHTLKEFNNKCLKQKVLAIDTEFIRDNTYYPILSLVQIAGEDFAAAIDPLSNINMKPIWELLTNENILKVFHSGRQDIEIFLNLTGEIPKPIYDTQIAAMFCGLGDQVGYERLVDRFLGLSINKENQFTNWLQRPLTKSQLDYAISDVTHLIKLFPLINKLIEDSGRQEWVSKEIEQLNKKDLYYVNPEDAWKRIKIKYSKPETLNILKTLAKWREEECIRRNIPRNRLIRDETLVNISLFKPNKIDFFKKIRGIPKNLSHSDLNEIVKMIKVAERMDVNTWPKISKINKKCNPDKSSLDLLKLLLVYCSEESGLAEKLIADVTDLKSILNGKRDGLKVFEGWRYEIFGNFVDLLLEGKLGFTIKNNKVKKLNF